jgi:ATP-binding cassette, subfamily B, vacuolar membrane transporter HMT1/ACLQ
MSLNAFAPVVPLAKCREILGITKQVSPVVTFLVFLISFVIYGIANAPGDSDKVKVHPTLGPGGRPLPQRRKSANQVKEAVKVKDLSKSAKLVFRAISSGLLLTWAINSSQLILQVIIYRDDHWWPGQAAVVR